MTEFKAFKIGDMVRCNENMVGTVTAIIDENNTITVRYANGEFKVKHSDELELSE